MSELKVYTPKELVMQGRHNEPIYIKSVADKVIAELKDKLQNVSELLKETREWLMESQKMHKRCADNAIKKIRHNKYKRCLAMARWCRMHDEFTQLESERLGLPQRTIFLEYRRKAMWFNKWHKCWLALADKFKEAK